MAEKTPIIYDDLPGPPMQPHLLYEAYPHGIAHEGMFYHFREGESFQFIRQDDGERELFISNKQGKLVLFEHWGPYKAHRTLEALRQHGELGAVLARSYGWAIEAEPMLMDVDIELAGPDKYPVFTGTAGLHMSPAKAGGEFSKVVINTTDGLGGFEKLKNKRPRATQMIAERLGVAYEDLSDRLLAAFVLLHELGHAYDYMTRLKNEITAQRLREEEMGTLPIPGMNPVYVLNKLEARDKEFYSKYGHIISKYGDIYSLARAQDSAYHTISTELAADRFAARILKANKK